jgi:hypothetical protein
MINIQFYKGKREYIMNINGILVTAGLAILVAGPGFAQAPRGQSQPSAPAVETRTPKWNTDAPWEVYGLAGKPNFKTLHVYSNGVDQGTDPDARVRQMLQLDPPYGQ